MTLSIHGVNNMLIKSLKVDLINSYELFPSNRISINYVGISTGTFIFWLGFYCF